jgi:GTP cyclohydrolase I
MIEAEHFCMKIRGVHEDHAMTVTTRFLGAYKKDKNLREEFLVQVTQPSQTKNTTLAMP